LTLLSTQFPTFGQGTAFTYQGRLNDGANPAKGNYDLCFALFDTNTNGNLIAGPVTNSATAITDGLFTVTLNFGNVFSGLGLWLEISVRTNGNLGAFTILYPRQPVQPVPYAIMAGSASNLLGALSVTQLNGTLPLAQLPGAVVTNGSSVVSTNHPVVVNAVTNPAGGNVALGSAGLLAVNNVVPFTTVSPLGIANGLSAISNNGAMFGPDTPGTTTCGIQEAINSISPATNNVTQYGGGVIYLFPGVYYPTTTIYTPTNPVSFTPKNPCSLVIEGSGEQSCVICYSGNNPATVMQIGGGRSGLFNPQNALDFSIRNLCFATKANGQTNMLLVDGINGGIFRAHIELCWFTPWQAFTNSNGGGGPADLIPIDVRCNLGADLMTIDKCQFYGVNSIYWATDHGSIRDCFFAYSGLESTWPSGSPFSFGTAICCGEPGSLINGNKDWIFERNYFEGCNGYYDGTSGGSNPVSYDDGWEWGSAVGVFTTGSRVWTIFNPKLHVFSFTNYLVSVDSGSVIGGATNVHVVDLTKYPGSFNGSGLTTNIVVTTPNGTTTLMFTNGILGGAQ
jgi:hypothetical protein